MTTSATTTAIAIDTCTETTIIPALTAVNTINTNIIIEQQDPSEFNALFMHLLERCLKGSVAVGGSAGESAGRSVPRGGAPPGGVADLFRIKAEMTTKCNSCGRMARHSDPCIELRLNLKVSAVVLRYLAFHTACSPLCAE
jgi:hypothetical protein